MLITIRKPWEEKASAITPEPLYKARRRFITGAAAAGAGFALGPTLMGAAPAAAAIKADWAGVPQNGAYSTDEEITDEDAATGYNNFYEFGTGKEDPYANAHKMETDPWTVTVDGACARPGKLDVETLIPTNALEERIYRLRCVEAWSMVIPWIGVPLATVLKRFEPTSKAKFVAFETLFDPGQMPGQLRMVLEWPYREGLRMDEAMHPLSLLAVGMYDDVMPNQNGAPVRLVVPWKYGFKSIKSIVRISFTETMPPTTWNMSSPREYGFYSNVNPAVDHPRWSQAKERRIGDFFKRETLPFNGYAEEVAGLYAGMDLKENY